MLLLFKPIVLKNFDGLAKTHVMKKQKGNFLLLIKRILVFNNH